MPTRPPTPNDRIKNIRPYVEAVKVITAAAVKDLEPGSSDHVAISTAIGQALGRDARFGELLHKDITNSLARQNAMDAAKK